MTQLIGELRCRVKTLVKIILYKSFYTELEVGIISNVNKYGVFRKYFASLFLEESKGSHTYKTTIYQLFCFLYVYIKL